MEGYMNKEEAYRILELGEDDRPEEIRRKYHLLMHFYHPDAAGDEDLYSLEMTKKLNEAFRFLKREGALNQSTIRDWGIRENTSAFCKRKIYMAEDLFGDEIIVDTGAEGRFYWEPDIEPFPLLLKSLGEAVNGLMDKASKAYAGSPFGELEESHTRFRAKLLHLLVQEYVDPYECIRLLYLSGQTESEDQRSAVTCRIRCHLKWARRKPEEETIPVRAYRNRLFAYVGNELAGQITFEEDFLYYIVTPLFLQGAVDAVLKVKEKNTDRKKNVAYRSAEMILQIDKIRSRI